MQYTFSPNIKLYNFKSWNFNFSFKIQSDFVDTVDIQMYQLIHLDYFRDTAPESKNRVNIQINIVTKRH